ncbi:C1 family peptidase [Siphonobacter sp. SORGH_AS_0500]|uniref:C1 family peptidase n=1 Tax=Siphonobacter sp. SORGH_AS_0500 TaxID=1864824 RepID=UPI002866D3E2|nr:C1 family peptidase [Siphonobacter sp. SORGH_AS_0500]MDR6197256.1 C1A family cysteine protease [Siphonobacter sp. SORGH_AS_0500]
MQKSCILLLIFILSIPSLMAQKTYQRGLVFNDEAYERMPMKAVLTKGSYDNLAKSISYEAYCPPIMDQGEYGTCVGFATTYYMRTILEKIRLKQESNHALAFSPSYTYEKIKMTSDITCQEGGSIIDALYTLQHLGAPYYQVFPYPNCRDADRTIDAQAAPHKIGDAIRLFGPLAPVDFKIKSLKKALNEGYPVVIGMRTPISFFAIQHVWEPAPGDEKTPENESGHAMCVIGYDDAKFGGAFRIANSWGDQWAENGYCWVRYKDLAAYTRNAYQAFPDFKTPLPNVTSTSLKGKLDLQLREGSLMRSKQTLQKGLVVMDDKPAELTVYQLASSYPAGTAFKALLTTSEAAYVYMIGTDKSAKMNALFPYAPDISPLLGPDNTVAYPSGTKSITLDGTKGTDYLIVLFSKKPLDFKKVLKQMQQSTGNLSHRLSIALKGELIAPSQVSYAENQPSFEVTGKTNGSVVPLIVAIDHK